MIIAPGRPEKVEAYPGGLLDGMAAHLSYTGKTTNVLTDNNENTTLSIYKNYTGVVTFTLPKPADIDSFKISIKQINNNALTYKFYNEAGTLIYSRDSLGIRGLMEVTVNLKSIKKITLDTGTDSWEAVIKEFDVFGQYDLATPTNIKVQPGVKKLDISFDPIEEAISYALYVDGTKHSTINTTSYELTGLEANKSYKIQLTAIHASGMESKLSAAVQGTPIDELINPKLTFDSKWHQIEFTWTNPYNSSTNQTLYINGQEVGRSSSPYLYELVVPGKEYTAYVTMIDRYNRTITSNTVTVLVPEKPADTTPPGKPIKFEANESTDRTSINLRWQDNTEPDLSGYNVSIEIDGVYQNINKTLITGTSTQYKPVKIGETYKFKLTAVDTSNNVSDPAFASVKVTELPKTDSVQQETSEYILITWTETKDATGYRIYFNGKLVGSVGPDVFEFKITKAMGYIPGALTNKSEVRPIFADGTEGGSNNSGGNDGIISGALDFIGVGEMLDTSVEFLKIYSKWIIIVLAVIFSPVLYGLIIYLINYSRRKSEPITRK